MSFAPRLNFQELQCLTIIGTEGLLERLDLRGKIVTGDAIFCQKSIAAKIVERGGDYVFPVKDDQKTLRRDIETAFNEPVFPPVLME